MSRTLFFITGVFAVVAIAVSVHAGTIDVGLGGGYIYNTIQAGIDAAVNGDTVVVHDGVYTGVGNRDIDLLGMAITLKSANGAASTIIDCESSARGFYLHSGETTASVIQGFTVQNGYTSDTLGALDALEALGTGGGGGMLVVGSGATVADCVFSGNYGRHGGGINCQSNSDLAVVGCTFIENDSGYGGGGFWGHTSTVTMMGCTFVGNYSPGSGGAMRIDESVSTLVNCLIVDNSATGTPESVAGGIDVGGGTMTLKHCTLTGNVCSTTAGAIHGGEYVTIINSVLWGNTPDQIYADPCCPYDVTYSDVEGGWTGVGNIDADPLLTGNYSLGVGSPCIDAGTDAGVYTDIRGWVRPFDYPGVDNNGPLPEFDMGAYEVIPEPAALGLVALGLLPLLRRLRKKD